MTWNVHPNPFLESQFLLFPSFHRSHSFLLTLSLISLHLLFPLSLHLLFPLSLSHSNFIPLLSPCVSIVIGKETSYRPSFYHRIFINHSHALSFLSNLPKRRSKTYPQRKCHFPFKVPVVYSSIQLLTSVITVIHHFSAAFYSPKNWRGKGSGGLHKCTISGEG